MSNDPHRLRGVPLDEDLRATLRDVIERDGVASVCRRLGLASSSLGRAVGGLPVQRGTVAIIAAELAKAARANA